MVLDGRHSSLQQVVETQLQQPKSGSSFASVSSSFTRAFGRPLPPSSSVDFPQGRGAIAGTSVLPGAVGDGEGGPHSSACSCRCRVLRCTGSPAGHLLHLGPNPFPVHFLSKARQRQRNETGKASSPLQLPSPRADIEQRSGQKGCILQMWQDRSASLQLPDGMGTSALGHAAASGQVELMHWCLGMQLED